MAFKSMRRLIQPVRRRQELIAELGPAYYVNATGGDDADSGRSPNSAWQTIGKVNGETFLPGDRILFKRGETWTGTTLTPPSDGAAASPIVFGAYGSGAKPIIDGNDAVDCVNANGDDYLTFENIEVTQGFSFGFAFTGATNIKLIDCDAHDCGNDNLGFYSSCANCEVTGGSFYDGYQRVVGPVIAAIEIADGSHDIIIRDVECYGQTGAGVGITIHSHGGLTMPYNITIENALVYNNAQHGIQILKQDNTADSDRNIRIINCTVTGQTSEGLRFYKSAGATNYPQGITVDGCVVKDNARYQAYVQADNVLVQRSVFHGDGTRMFRADGVRGFVMYNTTLYLITWIGFPPLEGVDTGARGNTSMTVENCIMGSTDAATLVISFNAAVPTTANIDYNLYHQNTGLNRWRWNANSYSWANWLINSAQDANSPAPGDPLFTNLAADDFTLQAGSPAVNAGVDVGLPYEGIAPDCGAYERE